MRDALARGGLVRVLNRFCEPFPGYYQYYPQRRHASRALQAFVGHLRRTRSGTRRHENVRRR
jgi:DNA-binding transcriptional LysR family regulator